MCARMPDGTCGGLRGRGLITSSYSIERHFNEEILTKMQLLLRNMLGGVKGGYWDIAVYSQLDILM